MRELISPWKEHLKNFYEYKRLCGYKYESSESVIYLFDRYYYGLEIDELLFTRDIVEPFLFLKENERIGNQNAKASVLRQFANYIYENDIIENIYKIPPISKKGEAQYIPYIYPYEELIKIIEYFDNLKPSSIPGTFKADINTYNCVSAVIKTLITTGMRLGEVTDLKKNNVDLENNIFTIKEAKNNNERIIPFSDSLKKVLLDYIESTPYEINNDDYFFSKINNQKIIKSTINRYFYVCLKKLGIPHQKGKGPRIHDFRHTFCVMCLTNLQKECDNVNLNLTYLSAYLGHKSIRETQKYIWLTPGLFEDTKNKMADYSSFIARIFEGEKYYD
ncbi:MAG: tyrosine-type recombinase/integrase [Bacilli bacterium]